MGRQRGNYGFAIVKKCCLILYYVTLYYVTLYYVTLYYDDWLLGGRSLILV